MSRQFTYTYKLPTLPLSFLAPGERARVSLVYGRGEEREGGKERERERERVREGEGVRGRERGRREGGREGNEQRKCHLWRVGVFPNCVLVYANLHTYGARFGEAQSATCN